jgi:hypothetical protein
MTVKVSRDSERSIGVLELESVSCIVEYSSSTELLETVRALAPGKWGVRITSDEGRTYQRLWGL